MPAPAKPTRQKHLVGSGRTVGIGPQAAAGKTHSGHAGVREQLREWSEGRIGKEMRLVARTTKQRLTHSASPLRCRLSATGHGEVRRRCTPSATGPDVQGPSGGHRYHSAGFPKHTTIQSPSDKSRAATGSASIRSVAAELRVRGRIGSAKAAQPNLPFRNASPFSARAVPGMDEN
jgi:hypothetical protein